MKYFSKILSICLALNICVGNIHAQVSLLQKAIDKIENYKNFTYQCSYKERESSNDTIIQLGKAIFLKAKNDKKYGYLFKLEDSDKYNGYTWINSYDGKNITSITIGDTTYKLEKNNSNFSFRGSLLGQLKWLQEFSLKNPYRIIKAKDTIINTKMYYHLVINTQDTIVDNKNFFTHINLFIDKQSDILNYIIWNSIRQTEGHELYYAEMHYFNYKFNQNIIDIRSIAIQESFYHPKNKRIIDSLLNK